MTADELVTLAAPARAPASMAHHTGLWTMLAAWRKTPSGSREYDALANQITGLLDDLLAEQLAEGRRDAHEFKVNLMLENHRLRATLSAGPWQQVDDLAMLVRRLVRALAQAVPGHVLLRQAMDYLQRKGLQGSPLRCPSAAAAPEHYHNGPEAMPRVRRMSATTLDAVIDGSAFRYQAFSMSRDQRDLLHALLHETAEETLARVDL